MTKNENDIKVSVVCMVYNHEKHLRKCLDGFVMQKTKFPFEVIVHDDASTDSSADIIREYEAKYPNIIKPIYQTENQYSKGIKIIKTIMAPYCKGDYWAICEGDDYWTDENKLQKQYDFMVNNLDCVMCTHATKAIDLKTNKIKKYGMNKTGFVTLQEALNGEGGHTSSFFYKKELLINRPDCFLCKGIGDFQTRIYATIIGKLYYIDEYMSVYNRFSGADSWMNRMDLDVQRQINFNQNIRNMLLKVDEYYNYEHTDDIKKKLLNLEASILLLEKHYKEIITPKYKEILKKMSFKRKIKIYLGAYTPYLLNLINNLRGN